MVLKNLKDPEINKPNRPEMEDLDDEEIEDLKIIYHQELKDHVKRMSTLKENKRISYSLIIGQCTPNMRAKVESHEDYEEASTNLDPILLLKMIKSIVFDFQEKSISILLCLPCMSNLLILNSIQTHLSRNTRRSIKTL